MQNRTVSRLFLIAIALIVGLAANPGIAQENTAEGNYASINGLEMYYEVYGEGEPLILIHGGFGGIIEFGNLIPLLAESRQVVALELQGHGRTADIDRPLTFEDMADDVAALIEHLGYDSADVLGNSLGSGVALQTAIRHPELVRKLVLVAPAFRSSDIHPEFQAFLASLTAEAAEGMEQTPFYQFYSTVAPELENWPTLVDKVGTLTTQEFDWTDQVAALETPTLVLGGDSDFVSPVAAAELFALLGGGVSGDFVAMPDSQLAILPATTHFSIITRTDLLFPIITSFLEAPLPEA